MASGQGKARPHGNFPVTQLQSVGVVTTINSQSIRVYQRDESGNVLSASGTVLVTDAGSGYAKGCSYIKTDVATGIAAVYQNVGTSTSCLFEVVSGGLVSYQEAFAFGDMVDGGGAAGTHVLSTTIPAGARFAFALISGITGFTGDTSAVIVLGDGTDVDRYMTGTPNVFVTAAPGVDMGVPSGTAFHAAAIATITATITSGSDFGLVTAGEATITLFYYQPL